MKVSFTALDLKSKIKEHKQKQDEKIMQNLQTKWSRKQCNTGFFGLTSAIISSVASPIITKKILASGNTKVHPLSLTARVGGAILGIGILAGYIFNKIDEKKNTKFGDFTYTFFNGPNSLNKNDSKIDTKA